MSKRALPQPGGLPAEHTDAFRRLNQLIAGTLELVAPGSPAHRLAPQDALWLTRLIKRVQQHAANVIAAGNGEHVAGAARPPHRGRQPAEE